MKRLTEQEELETYLGDSPHAPPEQRAAPEEFVGGVHPVDRGKGLQPRALSRVLAALILGGGVGLGVYGMETRRHAMGKDAFLATQSELWDRRYAETHGAAVIVAMIAAVGALAGVYELLVLGIRKAIGERSNER